jgi:hypothetical protein
MGLEVEAFDREEKRRPVADYVRERPDGDHWEEWLQSNRYELDAMATRQFINWLTGKFEEHRVCKVVPPEDVMVDRAKEKLEELVRENITARLLREAGFEGLVKAEIAATELPELTTASVSEWLAENAVENWTSYVEGEVEEIFGDE